MPDRQSIMLAVSSDNRSRVRLGADYFRKRATQCLWLAEETKDDEVAAVLRRLAIAFKEKAIALEE